MTSGPNTSATLSEQPVNLVPGFTPRASWQPCQLDLNIDVTGCTLPVSDMLVCYEAQLSVAGVRKGSGPTPA